MKFQLFIISNYVRRIVTYIFLKIKLMNSSMAWLGSAELGKLLEFTLNLGQLEWCMDELDSVNVHK